MPSDEKAPAEASIDLFLGEPTRDLERWAWLWTGDHPFPVRGRGGLLGRFVVVLKRLLRPLVKGATADLWDRQRVFNLILLETVERERVERAHLRERQDDFERALREHQGAIEAHARLIEGLDRRLARSTADVMAHNDALFARADQKLDRYRREARDLWHRLGALIAAADAAPAGELRRVQREQEYVELERRWRGSEEEIEGRVAAYLPYLAGLPGEVLDLGCGRGEALAVLARHGVAARGVDASGEMVARCRDQGLAAEQADLFAYLAGVGEATLGAVVSFHVVEHLPASTLERLVRLAWRALRPGGVLILETPSPLSLVTAARNFWIDPTHARPVHPASLEVTFREAGFEPVHRVDLHPFPDDERLPEIDLASLPDEQQALADHVNRLRDLLDDLLFGCRDFGMVGVKPRG
ncbi:MAG TPA: class I SAM-dependent methyltransferase [Thermoanaerobaculia bacterium]